MAKRESTENTTQKQRDEESEDQESSESIVEATETKGKSKKKKKAGIIYLSSVPDGMQYGDLYRYFSDYGEVGRIQLTECANQKGRRRKKYEEGWIEFLDKKKAKRCVLLANNNIVGGRKKNKWYEYTWSLKYLPKFQWSHLSERLAYEKAVFQQRMRTEIGQAKLEAKHFAEQLDRKVLDEKMAAKHPDWKKNKRKYEFKQRQTDEDIKKRKANSERGKHLQKCKSNVLSSLFTDGSDK